MPYTPAAHRGSIPTRSALVLPLTVEQALAEIVELANQLCEELADSQWSTAARIRHLAEASHMNGATP
ncbi:hypothetical protein OTB20_25220 [Streptomyces sp. H27-H1]|uniref:hypothetical protein n=1 Tax=unclassified Streptomyces TaxID=2593676 RepID=UPI0022701C19|nr:MULTISPECIES: hypothetical protein [unclassified Streptomyces]MCY0929440.1 hypothetical protein [Streptomyces sp. H27-H1]MCY0938344.1 hypothetical protein [Streptomyces sp. H34-S4]